MFNFDQYDWLNDTSSLGTKFGFQGLGGFGLQPEVDGSADKGAYEDYIDSSLYGTRRLVRQPDGRIDVVWEPGTAPTPGEGGETKTDKGKGNRPIQRRVLGSPGDGRNQHYIPAAFEKQEWGTGVLEQLFGFESAVSKVLDKIPGSEVAKNLVTKAGQFLEEKFGPEDTRPAGTPTVADVVITQTYPDSEQAKNLVSQLPELDVARFSGQPNLNNGIDPGTGNRELEFLEMQPNLNNRVVDLPERPTPTYETRMGKRSEIPSSGVADKVANVVQELYGDKYKTVLYSGQEPEGRAPVGTKDRHPKGFAGDFYFVDAEGKMVTDPEVLNNIAQGAAAMYDMNVGYGGDGYMSQGRMHFDTMPVASNQGLAALSKSIYPGGAQWGDLPPGFAGTLNEARAFDLMPPAYYDQKLAQTTDVIPQARWTPEAVAEAQPRGSDLPTRVPNEQMKQFEGMPPTAASIAKTQGKNLTESERSALMKIMANEFDHNKTRLDSPEGQAEMAMIVTTALNRAAEKNLTLEELAQDNNTFSNITTKTDVQRGNLVKHGSEMAGFLDTYFDPSKTINGFDPNITHYFNPDEARPKWAAAADFDRFGAHIASNLRPVEPWMWGKGPVGTPEQIDQYATDMTNYYAGQGFASPDYNRASSYSETGIEPGRSVYESSQSDYANYGSSGTSGNKPYESSNTGGDYGRNTGSSYSDNAYSPGGMVGHPSGGSAPSGYESSNPSGDYGRSTGGSSYSDNYYGGGQVGHPSGGSASSGYTGVSASGSGSSSSGSKASGSGSVSTGGGIGASGSGSASVGSSSSGSGSTPSDIAGWDAWI